MRLSYDIDADALAISIEAGVTDRTIEIDSGMMVDVDVDGHVLTIEIIRPARPWPLTELFERFHFRPEDRAVITEISKGSPTFDVRPLAPLAVA